MPPLPKDPAIRQRTNKATTRATLSVDGERRKAPALPRRTLADGSVHEWHKLTRLWWRDVWRSPMAGEYLEADVHGLYRLAALIDLFWRGPDAKLEQQIARDQQCFGLTPLDRRRLEWIVEKAEEAASRRQRAIPERPRTEPEVDDPRRLLQVVS